MKVVQKHTSPYNAAASDLVFHIHCRQFFSGRDVGAGCNPSDAMGGGTLLESKLPDDSL